MNSAINAQSSDEQDTYDMARLASGHDPSLNELMDRHAERLFQYLLRSLQNESDAADLAQETFVKVYQNCRKYDTHQKFSTWLYTIASNLVCTRYRWRARHPLVSLNAQNAETGIELGAQLPDAMSTPRELLESSECVETVHTAIAALPDDFRLPLVLAEFEDKSYTEIAEILNCSVKAVENRICRARSQLRVTLATILQPA